MGVGPRGKDGVGRKGGVKEKKKSHHRESRSDQNQLVSTVLRWFHRSRILEEFLGEAEEVGFECIW